MKLLVFAHTPPPHHGQSYMVQLMLNGFGGDVRKPAEGSAAAVDSYGIECYHVNARVSRELDDIGGVRIGKLLLLLGYCAQAIWCRIRHGVKTLYYVPAPGKRSALYRDWLVMLLCRPFFSKIILHWHAAGLAHWLETQEGMRTRAMTYARMGGVDLSIVLSEYNKADASKLLPHAVRVVKNGIPDPCSEFDSVVLPRRKSRLAARHKLALNQPLEPYDLAHTGGDPQVFRVLYLAHCTRPKGLFDTIDGVVLANKKLKSARSPFSLELVVAGQFVDDSERQEFDQLANRPECKFCLKYLGFVQSEVKMRALLEADVFCFPSYYQNENQPVNLIEAIAFGLPVITTTWRGIPEMFARDYPYFVPIRSPEQVATKLLLCLEGNEESGVFRAIFNKSFALDQYLRSLSTAFQITATNATEKGLNYAQ